MVWPSEICPSYFARKARPVSFVGVEDINTKRAEHEASGFHDLIQAKPSRQRQLTIGRLAAVTHPGQTSLLRGKGEGVLQVRQLGRAELAGIVDQHDGPLAEQVLAPVNVLDDQVGRAVAVLAALGLPDVNLRLLVRGVAQHHVDTGLAHVLVGAEVTDLPGREHTRGGEALPVTTHTF